MNLFLRAKHWQLFLITFALPFLLEIGMMVTVFLNLIKSPNPDPAIIFSYFRFFPLIMIVFTGGMLGWQWSVGVGLQQYLPQWVKMNVTQFKVFLIIPIAYIILILIAIAFLFNTNT